MQFNIENKRVLFIITLICLCYIFDANLKATAAVPATSAPGPQTIINFGPSWNIDLPVEYPRDFKKYFDLGDLDKDHYHDFFIAFTSRIFAISGRTGSIFWQMDNPHYSQPLGIALTSDFDGDGNEDLLMYDPIMPDSLNVVSAVKGTVIMSYPQISPPGEYIFQINTADLTGDGKKDVIIETTGATSHLRAFDGQYGTLLWENMISPSGGWPYLPLPFDDIIILDQPSPTPPIIVLKFGGASGTILAGFANTGALLWINSNFSAMDKIKKIFNVGGDNLLGIDQPAGSFPTFFRIRGSDGQTIWSQTSSTCFPQISSYSGQRYSTQNLSYDGLALTKPSYCTGGTIIEYRHSNTGNLHWSKLFISGINAFDPKGIPDLDSDGFNELAILARTGFTSLTSDVFVLSAHNGNTLTSITNPFTTQITDVEELLAPKGPGILLINTTNTTKPRILLYQKQ